MKLDQAAKRRPAKSDRKPRGTTRPDAQRKLTRMKQASEQAWQELLAAPDLLAPLPKRTIAIEQKDGTYLIYEIEKDGTRRAIGRYVSERFARKQQDD